MACVLKDKWTGKYVFIISTLGSKHLFSDYGPGQQKKLNIITSLN